MSQIGLSLAAVLAGVAFVVQQAVNTGLRGALGSGIWAGFTNFVVGAGAIALVALALREPLPGLDAAGQAPWYAWTGGVLGTLYILASVFIVPRLGAAVFVALFILGQMALSLALDHFGALGVAQHAVNLPRLAGAGLLVLGVALLCAD